MSATLCQTINSFNDRIMFCGITMKNYVAANVSQKSLTTVKCGVKMLSHSSESIIFIFLGVSTINDYHEWNTAFILLTVLFCTVFRAIGNLTTSCVSISSN